MTRRRGLSLVEICVVVGVIAVLIAIVLPNYRASMLRKHQDQSREELTALLNRARQTAVERNGAVVKVIATTTPMVFTLFQADGTTAVQRLEVPNDVTVVLPNSQTVYIYASNGTLVPDPQTGQPQGKVTFLIRIPGSPDLPLTLDSAVGTVIQASPTPSP